MNRITVLTLVGSVLVAAGAHAAMSGTASTTGADSSIYLSFSFDQYAVGTPLTSVSIVISNVSQQYSLRVFEEDSASTWSANLNGTLSLGKIGSATASGNSFAWTSSGNYSVARGSSTITPALISSVNGFTVTFTGDLSAFYGTGQQTVKLYFPSSASWSFGDGYDPSNSQDYIELVNSTRTADWSVVPEPTSMALLALGVATLGLRRKHGKKA